MTEFEKDASITEVLDRLQALLGSDAFLIADHWDCDPYAIGIVSPENSKVLVYITTLGEPSGKYTYILELPPPPDSDLLYQEVRERGYVGFVELVQVIKQHLHIT